MKLTLGVKLTLSSTLLVALVVALMAYVNVREMQGVHDSNREITTKQFNEDSSRRARSTAAVLAVSLREALEGTEIGTLQSVMKGLVGRDLQVVYAQVADQQGRILADSTREIEAANLPTLEVKDGQALLEASVEQVEENGLKVLRVREPILSRDEADKEARGLVVFGYDLTPLTKKLEQIEAEHQERTSESLSTTLLLGGAALALGLLLSLFSAYRFARPIRRLESAASRIADGELETRVPVDSADEIGRLGVQFNQMADRIQTLLVESVSAAELEHELNLARQIQSVLVPGEGTHTAPGLEVAGYYEPASTCGGDFWDFAALPRGYSTLLVGDVTGHGVPAAMLTATAKSCLDTLRHLQGENFQVAETLRVLDRVIRDAGAGTFFMTAHAAVLDTYQNTLFFSSAGHPPALLLRWTEDGIKLTRLVSRGNRLGDGDPSGYEARRTRVVKGDIVVWYTDGLIETINSRGKQFGTRRLLRALSQLDRTISPEEAINYVIDEFNRFRGENPLDDDVTLVVGRIS